MCDNSVVSLVVNFLLVQNGLLAGFASWSWKVSRSVRRSDVFLVALFRRHAGSGVDCWQCLLWPDEWRWMRFFFFF